MRRQNLYLTFSVSVWTVLLWFSFARVSQFFSCIRKLLWRRFHYYSSTLCTCVCRNARPCSLTDILHRHQNMRTHVVFCCSWHRSCTCMLQKNHYSRNCMHMHKSVISYKLSRRACPCIVHLYISSYIQNLIDVHYSHYNTFILQHTLFISSATSHLCMTSATKPSFESGPVNIPQSLTLHSCVI